ncbi:MAG: excinuclease ABC subunit UvrC [Spirochaetaceae bacterium]|jgi:excinuclease ABC subunit C|nr:excinuclease ABC subunit UvrC [Spirochaetaceae bacterium]
MHIKGDSYQALKTQIREAPTDAGVYIMHDSSGEIIYVGKAKNLRNRLGSYFNVASLSDASLKKDPKTATLLKHVREIETIIVRNEYEALLLENTLIKQHSPRYNINLKDGKTYPVIRITKEDFPRVFRTRRIIEDGSRYFGPYPNASAVDDLLELINKIYPLRKCRGIWAGAKAKGKAQPCVYYHIGRCQAPCSGRVSKEDYQKSVSKVINLLESIGSGEQLDKTILSMTEDMHQAAQELKFEKAAEIRNAIQAVKALSGDITVVDFDEDSRDYIASAVDGLLTTITVFSMRGGKLTGRELYRSLSAADEEDTLASFMAAYYTPANIPPGKIYITQPHDQNGVGANNYSPLRRDRARPVPTPIPDTPIPTTIVQWFRDTFGKTPEIVIADDQHNKAIIKMAEQNAKEDMARRLKERGAGPALDELARVLKLDKRPDRIEGFDIAQLGGRHPVASLISFKDGVPDKKNYRHFKLKSTIGIIDDFQSMREATSRRYSRLMKEEAELPDLVLIDGGIGQVNVVQGVFDELKLDIPIIGIAKRDEELWSPSSQAAERNLPNPVILERRSEALKVLQHVRDETHRFATGLNQKLRSKDLEFPTLESIEGIGPAKAAIIMKEFGSLDNLISIKPDELMERCHLTEASARATLAAARLAVKERDAARKQLKS